jgi:hypothetical protein
LRGTIQGRKLLGDGVAEELDDLLPEVGIPQIHRPLSGAIVGIHIDLALRRRAVERRGGVLTWSKCRTFTEINLVIGSNDAWNAKGRLADGNAESPGFTTACIGQAEIQIFDGVLGHVAKGESRTVVVLDPSRAIGLLELEVGHRNIGTGTDDVIDLVSTI